ncbi:XisI protein [Anaerolineales bacterium HSG24]|nr:XisI protein [Anaerolineales bacterium HSG24]
MDSQLNYRQIVKNILQEYAQYKPVNVDVTSALSFDDEHGHYVLLHFGWDYKKYLNHVVLHLQIIGDKIWIQNDETEEGIATDLLELGVPKEQIVLGFKHPNIRPYTEFATV